MAARAVEPPIVCTGGVAMIPGMAETLQSAMTEKGNARRGTMLCVLCLLAADSGTRNKITVTTVFRTTFPGLFDIALGFLLREVRKLC